MLLAWHTDGMSGDEGAAERRQVKIKKVDAELAKLRVRGIDDLDKKKQPQKPVQAPTIEALAAAHCQQENLNLHGRRAQIKQLLDDGLTGYEEAGNEQDVRLINSLLFDGSKYMNAKHSTYLAEKAQQRMDVESQKIGYSTSIADFEARRKVAFASFAEFLVDWLDEEPISALNAASTKEEGPVDETLVLAPSQLTPRDPPAHQEPAAQATETPYPPPSEDCVAPADITPSPKKPKKRKAILPASAAFVVLVVVAGAIAATYVFGGDNTDGKKEETKQPTTKISVTPTTPKGPAPVVSTAPSGDASSLTDLPTGDDLNISFGYSGFPTDLNDSAQAVFKEEDLGVLEDLLARPRIAAAPTDRALVKLIDARGYLLGGMKMNLVVTSKKGSTAEVMRVRPVNIKRLDKIPVGAAFLLPSQGGGEVRQMAFDMDSPSPIPRHPAGAAGPEGEPYFSTNRITIEGNDKDGEAISAEFSTVKGAYSFQIAIEYRVNGKKEREKQLVPGVDGKPGTFRIAADLCPLPGLKPRLKTADLKVLANLRYKNLRVVDQQNLEQGYSLIPADPNNHVVGNAGC